MPLVLFLALLLICPTGAVTLLLFIWLSEQVQSLYWLTACVQEQMHEADEANDKRHSKLTEATKRLGEATGRLIIDSAKGAADDTQAVKATIASLRHDLALDRESIDRRFDELQSLMAEDVKKTRKESQEIKTAFRDSEKDGQQAKRTVRSKKQAASKQDALKDRDQKPDRVAFYSSCFADNVKHGIGSRELSQMPAISGLRIRILIRKATVSRCPSTYMTEGFRRYPPPFPAATVQVARSVSGGLSCRPVVRFRLGPESPRRTVDQTPSP